MSDFTKGIPDRDAETRLVNSIKKGSRDALARVFDSYSPVLFGVIVKIVTDRQLAEQLLQAVFLQFRKEIGSYDPSRLPLLPHLLHISRKLALAEADKTGQAQQKIQNLVNHVYFNENANLVAHNTGGLPAFELIYFKGYSPAETAGILGMTVDELKQKLRTELNALREVKING